MANRPYLLAEAIYPPPHYEVVVLPWGATEAHNTHLPHATDVIECDAVAAEAGRLAWERGARVGILPTVPFGVQTGQLDVPICINLNPSTQAAILADVVRALEPHGVRKVVLLNGHGGNDWKSIVRELQPRTSIFLAVVNWYSCVDPRPYFDEPGDHAGELETSMMQHVVPHLVRPLSEAGPGTAKRFTVTGLREGWAWAPRRWTAVTSDTGVGDPARATPEKGAAFLRAVTERIADFLVELDAADPAALYA